MSNGNGWKVDLSGWTTMAPLLDWQEAAKRFFAPDMSRIMTGIVKTWPYEGDPADLQSYRDLTPGQWIEASKAVAEAIGTFFLAEIQGN